MHRHPSDEQTSSPLPNTSTSEA